MTFTYVRISANASIRIILSAALLILAGGVTTILARHFIPLPSTFMVHIKDFSQSNARILFIGSSFTGMGIDPEVLSDRGVNGFVFGVPAMGGEELEYVLPEILKRRPSSLECVWIEIKQWEPGAANGRSRHWRTLSPLGRGLLAFGEGGQGTWIVEPKPGRKPARGQLFSFFGQARWIDPNEGDIDWPLQKRLQEIVRAHGLKPVFYIPPTRIEPEPYVYPVEDFNNPVAFPELFRSEVRWDPTHLNVEGARRWSSILADRIKHRCESASEEKRTPPDSRAL